MEHQLASFVIRTKNESLRLAQCLERIRAQRWIGTLEIVVIDSGSTDGTQDIARRLADRLIEIRPEEFDYSRTLNQAIAASRGSLVVPISGHTVLRDDDWLARMAAVFADDRVAGAFCRQVPWPDADWTELVRLSRDFPADDRVWEPPEDCTMFSNAASVIRRDLWERHPFDRSAAEDLYWAKWAISVGFKIRYLAHAEAYHSHNDSTKVRARRVAEFMFAEQQAEGRFTGLFGSVRLALGLIWRSWGTLAKLDAPVHRRLGYALQVVAEGAWLLRILRAKQRQYRRLQRTQT